MVENSDQTHQGHQRASSEKLREIPADCRENVYRALYQVLISQNTDNHKATITLDCIKKLETIWGLSPEIITLWQENSRN